MKLLLLRSVWSGSNKLDELIEQTIAAGFNGIEGPIPRDESEGLSHTAVALMLIQHKLQPFLRIR